MQQINFTGNIELLGNTLMFSILKKVKEIIFGFLTRNSEIILNLFFFI